MLLARILVVEDEEQVRQSVDDVLIRQDYEVQTAESAEEGLERFEQQPFDVVISDVNLPGLDGIEMVKQMRALEAFLKPVKRRGA